MFASVNSIGLSGLSGYKIQVEVSLNPGISSMDIVGLPDTAIRESKERVISAIKNIGFDLPSGKTVINLAPADTRKGGATFDLPISIALLVAMEQVTANSINDYAFLGEISLNGDVRPISGILPMAISAKNLGIKNLVVPAKNSYEASIVKDINIYPANNLTDVIKHISKILEIKPVYTPPEDILKTTPDYTLDFSEVKGQENVKRAFEIAAAGGHNLILIGPPGSGKTMLSKRLPTILPDLTFDESLEITKIYSVCGLLLDNISLIKNRPFRNPHHSISSVALVGGGKNPHPGEISLAHNGVLFLDELPEFQKNVLEVMRQPLEDHVVTISRVNGTYTYPAKFMLVASMNPCPCGYYGSKKGTCTCSPYQIQNYLNKISGPLLDRIDLHIEVANMEYTSLTSSCKSESSLEIRTRVNNARNIQTTRYKKFKIHSNSELTPKLLDKFCALDLESRDMLSSAFTKLNLSARAYSRILKVARTIADLADSSNIKLAHIAEAIQYRNLDRSYFKF